MKHAENNVVLMKMR